MSRPARRALRLEHLEDRVTPVVFSNPASIAIPDAGAATPYPSTITVSGMGDQISALTVTLVNMNHTFTADLDILLVGPQGQATLLMSDVGGVNFLVNTTVTFAAGGPAMSQANTIVSGTYGPTDYDAFDTFVAPAPAGPYGASFTPFLGTNPNGAWRLFVVDDAGSDLGSISGGWSIDVTSAIIVSATDIVRASPNPTAAGSVNYTVTFNTPVTGVDASDFVLVPTGGVSGASVTGVSGSGTTYTVTVNTGTGDGTVGLNLVDDDTIADAAGRTLGGTGAGNGDLTGQMYTIDRPPTVTGLVRSDVSPTAAGTVNYTMTFSEAVTGVDTGDFTLATTGAITGAFVSGVTGSGATYTVTVDTGTGTGTLGLNLNASGTDIRDVAPNPLSGGFTGQVYTIDKTPPTVTSIALSGATAIGGVPATFKVTFSEAVTGVDTGDFTLATTGAITGAFVSGVTGSGATYTVTVDTGTGDGTLGLNLIDDDSIADAAGNVLTGAGAANGDFTGPMYQTDRTAPTVLSVVRASDNPSDAATVAFTVTFSEDVTGWSTTEFTVVTTGSVTGASVRSVARVTGTVLTVTVGTGTGAGTLGLDVTGNGIVDVARNPLGAPFTGGDTYDIVRVAPTVAGVERDSINPTTAPTVAYTVTFSEAVTGVTAAAFALTTAGRTSGASVANVTGSGTRYTVTVNTGTGAGTLRLDVNATGTGIRDLSGLTLAGGFTTGEVYIVLDPAPVVPPVAPPVVEPSRPVATSPRATFVAGLPGASPAGTPFAVFDPTTGQVLRTIVPFAGYRGALSLTTGDLNGDGTPDIVAGAGTGGGPRVAVFDGVTGDMIASFFAFGNGFTGGVSVAVGDVTGDGTPDLIVGAGAGGGPHVKVFDGQSFAEVRSFFAYDARYLGGVRVAVGDVNGDGRADVVTGTAAGGAPHVKAFSGTDLAELYSFFAFNAAFTGGVHVAVGDVDGDGFADIVVGAGAGGGPNVRVFGGKTGDERESFLAFAQQFTGGVSVAVGDVNGDGFADIVTGAGPGGGPNVKVFDGASFSVLSSTYAFGADLLGGVSVG